MTPLKIGIVGAGGIVRDRHLPNLRRIEGVEIAAIANSSLASAQAFCAAHAPEAEPIADWRELVARPDLDIVWIGATPYLHRPVTLAALAAGKHVFCQARMARDLREAWDMLEAGQRRPGQVTMLCPPPYGLRMDAFIRSLIESEHVGEIYSLELRSRNGQFLDPSLPPHWRQQREISGANVLTLGIYTEVLQRWFGDVREVAAVGRIFQEVREDLPIEIPDQLDVLAEFADGFPAVLRFSGVYSGDPEEVLEISGSRTTLRIDFATDEIRDLDRGETLAIPAALDRPWQVEADFIAAVRDPSAPRPHPTFADGVAYMSVVDAVDLAWRDRRPVVLRIPNSEG